MSSLSEPFEKRNYRMCQDKSYYLESDKSEKSQKRFLNSRIRGFKYDGNSRRIFLQGNSV